MTRQTTQILLVGCGKMGSALATSWSTTLQDLRLIALDRSTSLEGKPYDIIRSCEEIPSDFIPDIIILAVKPAQADMMLQNLRDILQERFHHAALMSVMAGKTCHSLAVASGNANMPVIRCMPNTPSLIQAGMTGIYFSDSVTAPQKELAEKLMCATGEIVILPNEADLQAVTAISGSGPAYIFLLAEILEKEGIEMGLSQEIAQKISRQMIYGAGKMLHTLPETATTLRENVTSPHGTTHAALTLLMEENAWPHITAQALRAAARRAEELNN